MAIQEMQHRVELALPSPTKLFTPGVTLLLILMIVGFALVNYAEGFVFNYLLLHSVSLSKWDLWKLVTYAFINDPVSLLFSGLILLFMGSAIEREWRTRSFLLLWVVCAVACAIIWILVMNLLGLEKSTYCGDGAAYGVVGAFGLVFRRKRFFAFFWTVEAQFIALLIIAVGVVIGIAIPITWIWVGGSLVAYIYIKLQWRLMRRGGNVSKPAPKRKGPFVEID